MNETILFYMMFLLVFVEIGLIISINNLSRQMKKWSILFKQAEEKIQNISYGIGEIRQVVSGINLFKKGELNLKGKTPLGEIDVDIKLGDKENVR